MGISIDIHDHQQKYWQTNLDMVQAFILHTATKYPYHLFHLFTVVHKQCFRPARRKLLIKSNTSVCGIMKTFNILT